MIRLFGRIPFIAIFIVGKTYSWSVKLEIKSHINKQFHLLAIVIPNKIYPCQTHIPGRHIPNSVHTVRDIINCINDSKLKADLII